MSEADVQALLDGVAAELDAAVALDDVELRLLAHTAHEVMDDVRRASIVDRRLPAEICAWVEQWGIREASGPVRLTADTTVGVAFPRWCIPVRFREVLFGYVWVLDTRGIAESDLGPAVEAANQIGALLHRRRLLTRIDADLLRLLLIPNPESESVAAEARALGTYTHNGPVAVIVVGTPTGDGPSPAALSDLTLAVQRAAGQASPEGALAGVISGLGVLLAPLRNRGDLASAEQLAAKVRRFAAHVTHDLEVVAAIGSATELERASHSYAEARRALRMVRAMPDLGPIATWDSLGVFRALALLPVDDVESGVLDPRVHELLADEGLAITAETFLDLAGNVHETAARLYVHRTTLYQRLDRIAALYKLDLRHSGDHRLITHLGLKLARVANL